jgi:FkbM family methyltransferase
LKHKIKSVIERYIVFRPILWVYFIYLGELYLRNKKLIIPKVLTEIEKSQLLQIDGWNDIEGDNTLRVNYNLNKNSLVLDIGGFEGNWSAEIYAKYSCEIIIFEPYPKYFNYIKKRFSNNERIKIIPAGLGGASETVNFFGGGDWSSTFDRIDTKEIADNITPVEIIDAIEYLSQNKIEHIDLIKINIEGGEYELLERIIDKPIIKSIGNIQVQFHNLGGDYKVRMNNIQKKLAQTHKLTYYFEFLWENWMLK